MHGHGVTAAPPIHLLLSFSHSLFNSYCIRCGDIAHQMKIKAGAWCGSRQSGVRCDCRTQCRMDVSYKIYVVDWYCNCDMAFSLCAHSFRSEAVKMAFSFSLLLFAITLCEWCDLICDMDRWQAGRQAKIEISRSLRALGARFHDCALFVCMTFSTLLMGHGLAAFANTFWPAFIRFQTENWFMLESNVLTNSWIVL